MTLPGQTDLQLHLCAVCGEAIEQPRIGRPRRTCSDACRKSLQRLTRGCKPAERRREMSRNAPEPDARAEFRDVVELSAGALEHVRRFAAAWGIGGIETRTVRLADLRELDRHAAAVHGFGRHKPFRPESECRWCAEIGRLLAE